MFKALQYGINLDPRNDAGHAFPADPAQLKGLGWVRIVLKADAAGQSLPDALSFYDPLVALYRQHGVGTLFVLNQETVWGNGPWGSGGDPGAWSAYAQAFADAAGQIAARFKGRGVAYEIWNEGDLVGQSSVPVPAALFANVLSAAQAAIKAQDPAATVVFGGLAAPPEEACKYVSDVRAALGSALPVDAIGVHPYGKWPPNFAAAPGWGGWFGPLDAHLQLFASKFPDTPLWITEVGISEHEAFPQEQFPLVIQYMEGVFDLCQRKFNQQIAVVIWFAWSDGMRNAGLVGIDGQPKSGVFERFFDLTCRTPLLPPPGALTPTTGMNIRSGGGTQFARVDGAMPGDWLEPLEEAQMVRAKIGQQGQWINVRTPGGKTGWAAAWLLKPVLDAQNEQTSAPPEPAVLAAPAEPPAPAATPTPAPAPEASLAPAAAPVETAIPAAIPIVQPVIPAAPQPLTLTPTGGINVRSGAGTGFASLGGVNPGDALQPLEDEAAVRAKLGQQGQWINVRIPDGRTGFVAAWLVRVAAAADLPKIGRSTSPVETVPLTATQPDLNVRGGPGRQFGPVGTTNPGVRLSALEPPDVVAAKLKSGKNWVYVRLPNGAEGWAAAWLLRAMSGVEAAASAPAPMIGINNPADVPADPVLGRQRALDFDHVPCFVRLPVCDIETIGNFSGFGPNNFSYRTWRMNPETGGLYNNLGGLHSGLDFGIPLRTALCSMDWGYVVYVGPSTGGTGYGAGPHNVIVRYGRYVALFGHMTSEGVIARKGDILKPGDPVGLSWTFNAYDHLHFEMRRFDPAYPAKLRQKAESEGAADVPLRMNELFHQWGWTPQPDHWINPAPFFNPGLETYWTTCGWKHAASEPADSDNNGFPDRVTLADGSVPTAFDLYSVQSMPPGGKPHFFAGSRA